MNWPHSYDEVLSIWTKDKWDEFITWCNSQINNFTSIENLIQRNIPYAWLTQEAKARNSWTQYYHTPSYKLPYAEVKSKGKFEDVANKIGYPKSNWSPHIRIYAYIKQIKSKLYPAIRVTLTGHSKNKYTYPLSKIYKLDEDWHFNLEKLDNVITNNWYPRVVELLSNIEMEEIISETQNLGIDTVTDTIQHLTNNRWEVSGSSNWHHRVWRKFTNPNVKTHTGRTLQEICIWGNQYTSGDTNQAYHMSLDDLSRKEILQIMLLLDKSRGEPNV